MTYELAKQLKDTGFPKSDGWEFVRGGTNFHGTKPTLSELIEACPKEIDNHFFSLSANSQGWIAVYEEWESELIQELTSEGKTPKKQ